MPRPAKKSKTKAKKRKAISIVFDIAGEMFKGSGNTIVEAIEQITPPNYFKGKGVITVSSRKLKAETLMWPPLLKRLFINKTYREIFQKKMLLIMK